LSLTQSRNDEASNAFQTDTNGLSQRQRRRSWNKRGVLDDWARITEAIVNECAGTALRVPSGSSGTGVGTDG
jgi:hypothetical protein